MVTRIHIDDKEIHIYIDYVGTKYETMWRFDLPTTDLDHTLR